MVALSKEKLKAFLTPIAFYRAIKGSYNLAQIKALVYGEKLSVHEWQEAVRLYNKYLPEERLRNLEQAKKHTEIKKQLAHKLKKLKTIVQAIPEITDILLVNSYSLGALKSTSDIDLLVICKPDLLWWARLKLTAALERAGIRRKPGHIEEQICLSFFVTTESLNMQKIALIDDIYLHYWTSNALPLFGRHRTNWQQENKWLQQFLPATNIKGQHKVENKKVFVLSYLANRLVRIPLRKRTKAKAQKLGPESSIVVSDSMLKFHNEDRRGLYRDKTLVELAALEQLF